MNHKSTFLDKQILKIAKSATESSASAVKQICKMVNSVIEANKCVNLPIGCGKPITEFRDDLGAKEYRISGRCQACQVEFYHDNDDGMVA